MSDESVAYQALHLARQNERDIERHEKVCAERYEGIHDAIDEMKSGTRESIEKLHTVLWKAGGAAFSIIIAILGFLVTQQISDNRALHDKNQAKIEALTQALADARAHPPTIEVKPNP